jgi:hypothetical protein
VTQFKHRQCDAALARDRIDGNEYKLIHEFLSVMLGVRRSGIATGRRQELERRG